MKKRRIIYLFFIVITLVIGLSSRKYPYVFSAFLAEYLGDVLWAMLVFWLISFISLRNRPSTNVFYALMFSYIIEISQLYHAPWIDNIRNSTLGSLILGHGFLWSDIVCYTIGIFIGFFIDIVIRNTIKVN